MGREVSGMQVVDKKPNGVITASNDSSNDKVCISPNMAETKVQAKDHEVKEYTEANSFVEKCHENKDVVNAKTTNCDTDLLEEEIEKSEVQNPSDLVTPKYGSHTEIVDTETVATGLNLSPNTNNMHSPISSRNSQVIDVPASCHVVTC